jgi:hypothetical protein
LTFWGLRDLGGTTYGQSQSIPQSLGKENNPGLHLSTIGATQRLNVVYSTHIDHALKEENLGWEAFSPQQQDREFAPCRLSACVLRGSAGDAAAMTCCLMFTW